MRVLSGDRVCRDLWQQRQEITPLPPSIPCPLSHSLRFALPHGPVEPSHIQAGEKNQSSCIADAVSPLPPLHEILRRTNTVPMFPSAGHSEWTQWMDTAYCLAVI